MLTLAADLDTLAAALDRARTLTGSPLDAEHRAAIFAAVDSDGAAEWIAARSSIITTTGRTLWQAVADLYPNQVQGRRPHWRFILDALDKTTTEIRP